MRAATAVCLLLVAFAAAAGAKQSNKKPNIVLILADDMGLNELNYQNGTRGIITPHLDALANSGIRLTNYYVNGICSPTRSALHTGRYTHQLGTQSNVIYWDTPWGISLREKFLPQNLKDAGYHTGMFGKWHLGMFKKEYEPNHRGYDVHHGYYQGCESAWTHVACCCVANDQTSPNKSAYVCPRTQQPKDYRGYDWFANGTADISANGTKSVDLIRDRAISFLDDRAKSPEEPFFLYLPFQNIHLPYIAEDVFYNMYANASLSESDRILFAYITELDTAVGNIMQKLIATGQMEDTVIIFSSDNGAPPDGPTKTNYIDRNYPLRGWKGGIWEGGVHVLGFVSGPLIPEARRGGTYGGLFHVTDWLTTIVEGIVGEPLQGNLPQDGHNQWPAVVSNGKSPRDEMVYGLSPLCGTAQANIPTAGLRSGPWKLLSYCYEIKGVAGGNMTRPLNKTGDPLFDHGPALFNLENDPSETTNVAKDHPDIVATMVQRFNELADKSVEPMQWTPPFQGPDYECADCPQHPSSKGPMVPWGPWL